MTEPRSKTSSTRNLKMNIKTDRKGTKDNADYSKRYGELDYYKEYIKYVLNYVYELFLNKYHDASEHVKSYHDNYLKKYDFTYSLNMKYVSYLPFVLEMYYLFLGSYMLTLVRAWFFINYVCILLSIYDDLSERSIKDRFLPVTTDHVKKLGMFTIVYGAILILLSTGSMGLLCTFMIIYLINRTSKKVFNRGF